MIKLKHMSRFELHPNNMQANSGFAILFALIIGTVMLILAVSLFSFVGHQHSGIHTIVSGEVAHFLAEAGINSSIGNVRQAITEGLDSQTNQRKLYDILTRPGNIKDIHINNMLNDTWNAELQEFAREVDKDASIDVQVWLRDFQLNETTTTTWSDPVSRQGRLVIEATGKYGSARRTISVSRVVKVTNILPGPATKFTLFVPNASRYAENSFNLIRNDYRGMITDGPRPLILHNHTTADTPQEPANIAHIIKAEKDPQVWQQRGWVWLGNRKIRLNLCSGAGDLGEIFHFYDVGSPNEFTPVKFVTPDSDLPRNFLSPIKLPWDKSGSSIRSVDYSFGHGFVLDGFHDRSNRKETDAMYEGDILSSADRSKYSSRSSILHLFGEAKEGYQSRTRVFGQIYAAFPRFATLEVTPKENDVARMFKETQPPPLYLMPSLTETVYKDNYQISDFLGRQVGGPIVQTGLLFRTYSEYSMLMSRIAELPYALSYNSMQDIIENTHKRTLPSERKILTMSQGGTIKLERDEHTFFDGVPSLQGAADLMDSRVHASVETIADFWQEYLNGDNELELNAVIKIINSRELDMTVPPTGMSTPLVVKGGGAIVIENGNLNLRGVTMASANEALTIVVKGTSSITFSAATANQVNLIAPKSELAYSSRIDLYGVLGVSSIYADHRFQGGYLRWRQAQDPTDQRYSRYYKIYIDSRDSYWHE